MARELTRLEDLNKSLRDKMIKYKSKITEQDGVIKGLQGVIQQ